jgi:hypothetical protein
MKKSEGRKAEGQVGADSRDEVQHGKGAIVEFKRGDTRVKECEVGGIACRLWWLRE